MLEMIQLCALALLAMCCSTKGTNPAGDEEFLSAGGTRPVGKAQL